MLRVQCEQCKAPYQVDERRVPTNGLKMRCPKCGHTFTGKVDATAPDRGAGPPSSPGQPRSPSAEKRGQNKAAMRTLKQTMIGFGSGGAGAPQRRPQKTLVAFDSSGAVDGDELSNTPAELPARPGPPGVPP